MVGVNSTLCTMKIATSLLGTQVDCQKLMVGSTTITLGPVQLPAEICYWPSILHQNCTYSNIRCVGFNCIVGGYTACGIPLVWSANENGNGILLNGIPFNGIPFPIVSVKQVFGSYVSVHFRSFPLK